MNNVKDSDKLLQEAVALFTNGDIFSPSISKLTEYIQVLISNNTSLDDRIRSRNTQYANTLKDIVAIKTTETLTKDLHKRTSISTWVIIAIAIINAVVGIIYIFLLLNKEVHEKEIYKQQTEINQKIIEKLDDLSVTK